MHAISCRTVSIGVFLICGCAAMIVMTFADRAFAAPPATMRFKVLSVKDSQVNNIEAFRMAVPTDWQAQGGVVWRHDLSNLAHAHMRIASPDGKTSLDLLPIIPYVWSQQGIFGFQPGSNYLGNIVISPMEPGVYVQQIVLPNLRKDVECRLVSRTPMPEVAKAIGPTVQEQGVQKQVLAERVRVEYALPDGSVIEEDFYCAMVYATSPIVPGTTYWSAARLYSFRAPKGTLDAQAPLLHAMAASTRLNIQWINAYQQVVGMWQQNVRDSIQQAGAISRYIARINDEITEINRRSYENQQRTYERVNRQFSQYIRGVETYKTASTDPIDLPSGYNNAWVSDRGEYVLSSEAGYNPNTAGADVNWHRMERVEP